MSTQTGIRPNQKLQEFFAKLRDGSNRDRYRMLKVVISKEELCLDDCEETSNDWRKDWNRCIPKAADNLEPCFLFYR